MTAFTLGADHAAQLAVWRQLRTSPTSALHGEAPADPERRRGNSDLGTLVGIAAYEAAGGTVTRDLFTGDEDGFMDDAALVRRLAIEKLEAEGRATPPLLGLDQGGAEAGVRLHGAIRARPSATGRLPPEIAGEIERIEQRPRSSRKPPGTK